MTAPHDPPTMVVQATIISCLNPYNNLLTGLPAFNLATFHLFLLEQSKPSKMWVGLSHSSAQNLLCSWLHTWSKSRSAHLRPELRISYKALYILHPQLLSNPRDGFPWHCFKYLPTHSAAATLAPLLFLWRAGRLLPQSLFAYVHPSPAGNTFPPAVT